MPSGTPWVKWRLFDFKNSLTVQLMPGLARMLYRSLLDEQFAHGSVPDDPARCATLLGVPLEFVQEWWPYVRPCFGLDPDKPGMMAEAHATAMIEERVVEYESIRAVRAEAGRRGGLAKAANASSKALANANQELSKTYREGEGERERDILANARMSGSVKTEPSAPEKQKSQKQLALDLTADRREAAKQILDAAWPVIKARHPDLPFSVGRWRQLNTAAARNLVHGNRTPGNVVRALECAYTAEDSIKRQWDNTISLAELEERWVRLQGIAAGRNRLGTATRGEQQDQRARAARGAGD